MKRSLFLGFIRAALLLVLLPMAASATVNRLPQGGGVIYPAWTGTYWANPKQEGAPAYVRSDIRVRFDWEDWRPILGVKAESVSQFPREGVSVRWTARLVARFAEDYTLKLTSDEQARLQMRPEGGGEWTTLIDAWAPHARRTDTATMALQPGTRYDVRIDYANLKGDAVCVLSWSSPSTPEEVVDYVSGNSVNFMIPQLFADAFSFAGAPAARPSNAAGQNFKVDENGWPTEDFSEALLQGYSLYCGRGQIVFKGQAEVSLSGADFEVNGQRMPRLPKGVGYDPAKNETRAHVHFADRGDGTASSTITMMLTQRTPQSPVGSGVTDLHVMLPKQVHGTEPHEPGEIIHQEGRDAFLPVFSFRVQRTGLNDIVKWEERTLPSYSKIMGQFWRADMAYEKLVLAANELGRDMHLNFSGSCDETFMRKLAQLAKYGSDGREPYTRPTPNPVWPPLSPNLRLYLEHGNEMGWSAIQPTDWTKIDYERIRKEKGPVYDLLNFDGKIENDHHLGIMRYHAYRTAKMSEAMREVWGDEAMGETVRVCLFGQYERWFQNGLVQFLDDTFNNPGLVKTPRRPNELLWASGPAVYYGSVNNFMAGDVHPLANGRFEACDVGAGQAVLRPQAEAWTFEGQAGIVDLRIPRHAAVASAKPAAPQELAGDAAVGFAFTVGDRDLFVYDVGRVVRPGEQGKAKASIIALDGRGQPSSKHPPADLGLAKAGDTVYTPLEYCGWATSDSSRIGVWRLEAGSRYAAVTEVAKGPVPGSESALAAGPGLRIEGAVIAEGCRILENGVAGGELRVVEKAGCGFPLVNFRYAFALEPAPGLAVVPSDPCLDPTWKDGGKGNSTIPPFHRQGTKAAFLSGKAKMTQSFEIEQAGEYALVFTANGSLNNPGRREGDNPFTVVIDGKTLWDTTVGEGRKPNGGVFQWGTRYTALEPGTHLIVIETRSENPKDTVYFYALHLGNLSDYYGGPTAKNFIGAGGATGQTDGQFTLVARLCAAMAQLWGLVPYAYEGGTNAGGDWNGGKLDYTGQFKWEHPVSKIADNQWARFWHAYGGANAFYYYEGFPAKYVFKAEAYKPWEAAIERSRNWELEPSGPVPAPVVFTPADRHYQGQPGSTWQKWYTPWTPDNAWSNVTATLSAPGIWKGFVFRAPKAGTYAVTVATTPGGTAETLVDGVPIGATGASGAETSAPCFLTQGVHAVRIRNVGGSFDLVSIDIR